MDKAVVSAGPRGRDVPVHGLDSEEVGGPEVSALCAADSRSRSRSRSRSGSSSSSSSSRSRAGAGAGAEVGVGVG
eukprot:4659588-Alexandrium_andersonii.AAC.1